MALVQKLFDKGPQGASYAIADDGAALKTSSGNGPITYDTAAKIHGAYGLKFVTGGTASTIVRYAVSSALIVSGSVWINVSATGVQPLQFTTDTGGQVFRIEHRADTGMFAVVSATGAAYALSSVASDSALNTWYRVEFSFEINQTTAGSGKITARRYTLAGAQVGPTVSVTTANMGTAVVTRLNIGVVNAATSGRTVLVDDLQWDEGSTVIPAPIADPVTNPFAGKTLYVNPSNPAAAHADSIRAAEPNRATQFDKIGDSPTAIWAGDWIPLGTEAAWIDERVTAAAAVGALPLFVLYNSPLRDSGEAAGYSGGGAANWTAYNTWIQNIITGFKGRPGFIVYEPDALGHLTTMVEPARAERVTGMKKAILDLKNAGLSVYVDAGHDAWHSVAVTVGLLNEISIGNSRGLALNTSNYRLTGVVQTYGEDVIAGLGLPLRMIIDTSRNGLGPDPGNDYINPPGRAIGLPPVAVSDTSRVDALVWVKSPGESDGNDGSYQTFAGEVGTSANGTVAPNAGGFWPNYAYGLAARSSWGTAPATDGTTTGNPKTETVSSDFTTVDLAKFPGSYGYTVTGGVVEVVPASTYPRVSTGTGTSDKRYTLVGSYARVEVPQIAAAGAGTISTTLQLETPAGVNGMNALEMLTDGTNIIARQLIDGGGYAGDIVTPYSAANHRHWRISEAAGTITWAVSPDGAAWTTLRSSTKDPALDITKTAVALVAGFYGTETAPGVAKFDNLNVVAAGSVPVVADFAAVTSDSRAPVSVTGSATNTPTSWAWRQVSGPAVTITQSGAAVSFTAPATPEGASIVLGLTASNAAGTSTEKTVTVTVAAHVWWKILPNNVLQPVSLIKDWVG